MFYDKLFSSLDFTLPKAATGRRGFPKEAMVCAFIVMKCEGFSQITDLADYLDNNRIIAHYWSFCFLSFVRGSMLRHGSSLSAVRERRIEYELSYDRPTGAGAALPTVKNTLGHFVPRS